MRQSEVHLCGWKIFERRLRFVCFRGSRAESVYGLETDQLCMIPTQAIGEAAIHRLENQISEQYYEQDILEKCGHAPPGAVLGDPPAAETFLSAPSIAESNKFWEVASGRRHFQVTLDQGLQLGR